MRGTMHLIMCLHACMQFLIGMRAWRIGSEDWTVGSSCHIRFVWHCTMRVDEAWQSILSAMNGVLPS